MSWAYFGFLAIAAASLCCYFRADIREWLEQIRPWNLERDGSVNERMKRALEMEGQ